MVIALSSPSATSPITLHLHNKGRVSSASTSTLSILPIPIPAPSGRFFPLSYWSSNVRGLQWFGGQRAATCCLKLKLVAEGAKQKTKRTARNGSHSRTFLDASSEAELLSGIIKETELGRLSPTVASGMEETFWNYRNAVLQSGVPYADEIVLTNMGAMFDRVLLDLEEPFEFSPYHRAIREPFDYYMFGQNYIRPLIDFSNSYVGNVCFFYEIKEKLQQGHNIILMSNHQTEPDPAVIGLLLEKVIPLIVENMVYVAGDRVITDPLCKPFSMGRNLLCVYSKKHMHDNPELVEMKRRANTRSLKEMALLLREGAKVIWIAPSGGRDRPDPITEDWYPAPFDVSSVDNMRRLVEHSGIPGHVYPLAILCYDIMPPPLRVEKEIGEKRVISFHGTGLSVAQEMNYHTVADGFETESEAKLAYAQALYDSVSEQYSILKAAVYGKQGLSASTSSVSLSQPWT